MARSLKKGPYVFDRLLNRVRELNKNGKKKITKEKTNKELIRDSKYQMTEINNYLKVRKRS